MQHQVMAPRNFCDKLSQNWRARFRLVESTQVLDIARREALHAGERGAKVASDLLDCLAPTQRGQRQLS